MHAEPKKTNLERDRQLETSQHLFQLPQYTAGDGYWSGDFNEVASRCPSLTWDPAAFLSYLSYGYVSGDRTLLQEVRRQPWLSRITQQGEVELESPPRHDFYRLSPTDIGSRLLTLLEDEAEAVCSDRSDVYVLTSGGLDSRIVAGVMRRLLDQGRVNAQVHAVTWGRSGSRDVEIGKVVAEKLNFPWTHLDLGPDNLVHNIDDVASQLGALVSPIHLHRMMWFRDLPVGALVLGGSYGDSVGRAEFAGRTVLELLPYQSSNLFGLLNPPALATGQRALHQDWKEFRSRFQGRPDFGIRECEFQSHYMRGMISQTMSVINNGACDLYQMFTSPEVYGFIWSLHPSFRDDRPYENLLKLLGHDLQKLPWARTNRSLGSGTVIPINAEYKQYHDYPKWIRTQILSQLNVPEIANWFVETGMFDKNAVLNLFQIAEKSQIPYEIFQSTNLVVWLLALRKLPESLARLPTVNYECSENDLAIVSTQKPVSGLRRSMREIPFVLSTVRSVRKWIKRRQALKQYPPKSFVR